MIRTEKVKVGDHIVTRVIKIDDKSGKVVQEKAPVADVPEDKKEVETDKQEEESKPAPKKTLSKKSK